MGRTGSRSRQAKLAAAGRKGGQAVNAPNRSNTINTVVRSTTTHLPSISDAVVDNRRQSTAHTHKTVRIRDPSLTAPSGSAETPETLLSHEMMIFESGHSSSSADHEDTLQSPIVHISSDATVPRSFLHVATTITNTNPGDTSDFPVSISRVCKGQSLLQK